MVAYGGGRYDEQETLPDGTRVCRDVNLGRRVWVHQVSPVDRRDAVRTRLAALQAVRSPYVALVYDMIEEQSWIGVVEEALGEPVVVTEVDFVLRLYQLCAGLAALHEQGIAHGNLTSPSFRTGPLRAGRLCNLAFLGDALDDPATDRAPLAAMLEAMGAAGVADPTFQQLRSQLTLLSSRRPPEVETLRDRLAALLLRDRHRALLYWPGRDIELGASRRSARFAHPVAGIARVVVQYDGTRFYLAEVDGEVRVNQDAARVGEELRGSCVIALGSNSRPLAERYFVTFDPSHPEVA